MFVLIDYSHTTAYAYLCADEEHVIRMCNYIMAFEGDETRISSISEISGCDFSLHEIPPIPEDWT